MAGRGGLEAFLGGSLFGVVIRLIILSIIIGAVLAFLGLAPQELFARFWRFLVQIFDLGLDSLGEIGRWLVAGALIVVPLFIISRLWQMRR